MRHFALSVIGRDQPGIVAAVTGALLDHGANLEDSQSTILRGHFSMTAILAVDDEVAEAGLTGDLEAVAAQLGMEAVTVSAIEAAPAEPVDPSHIVTVHGPDHPGIVHAVASALAEAKVNITDLNTRLVGDEREDLYAMMLEVTLPRGLEADGLESLLEAVCGEQGVKVTVGELKQDAL